MTALDSNVLIRLVTSTDEQRRKNAEEAVFEASRYGSLVVSPIVFAEFGAHPKSTAAGRDEFLRYLHIDVDWVMAESIWRYAADKFGEYADRRRRSNGDAPRRLIADFVIGAHAAKVGRLVTGDVRFFRSTFPELQIIEM